MPISRSFIVDVAPLRESRDFRLLFAGQAVSSVGRQLTVVAAPVQIFALTGSTLMVGMLGLVQFPALLVGSFFGGVLADTRDRRSIFFWAQFFLAITTAGLAINAMAAAPSITVVFGLTSANAFLSGIDNPSRTAAIPRLVSADGLPAALALQVLMLQAAGAVGPAAAGLIIAKSSLAMAFWIDTATFFIAMLAVFLMRPIPPQNSMAQSRWKATIEGFRFLSSKQELKGIFLIDINAMVLGMPRALFPEFGIEVFRGTEATVGYLFAAPGIGAMVASLTSGWIGRIHRLGRATTIAVVVWGLGVAGFAISPWLWLSLALLAFAGASDALSAVFRSTILQLTTPDQLRGRLSAIQIAVVTGGPRIGDAEAGLVSGLLGPRFAACSGGVGSAMGALVIAQLLPRFRGWVRPSR